MILRLADAGLVVFGVGVFLFAPEVIFGISAVLIGEVLVGAAFGGLTQDITDGLDLEDHGHDAEWGLQVGMGAAFALIGVKSSGPMEGASTWFAGKLGLSAKASELFVQKLVPTLSEAAINGFRGGLAKFSTNVISNIKTIRNSKEEMGFSNVFSGSWNGVGTAAGVGAMYGGTMEAGKFCFYIPCIVYGAEA